MNHLKLQQEKNNTLTVLDLKTAYGFIECVTFSVNQSPVIFILYDVSGRMLVKHQEDNVSDWDTHQIDVSNVDNGVYFLEIYQDKTKTPILKKNYHHTTMI